MTALAARVHRAVAFAAAHPTSAISSAQHYIPGSARPVATTGYYGRHDHAGRQRTSKVHVRLAGERRPLCGIALHPDMAWHWCASRAEVRYIECDTCKSMLPAAAATLAEFAETQHDVVRARIAALDLRPAR